jgi:hypothetical protein
MGDLVQVITAYGYRTEVSRDTLLQLYGAKYANRLATALGSLIESGKIVEFVREDTTWYKLVK